MRYKVKKSLNYSNDATIRDENIIIKDFISKNSKTGSYVYQELGRRVNLDTFVKRKELKRRSDHSVVLTKDNQIVQLGHYDYDYNDYDMNRLICETEWPSSLASIGLDILESEYNKFYIKYALAIDGRLFKSIDAQRLSDMANRTEVYKNVFEFSCRGSNTMTLDFRRNAFVTDNCTANSIIEIANGRHDDMEVGLSERNYAVCLGINGKTFLYGNADNNREEVKQWKDIVSIDACDTYVVGLKRDGRVIAVGGNYNDRCNVNSWVGIVDIAASEEMTLGLKEDGTVICTMNIPGLNNLKNIVGVSNSLCVNENGGLYFISKDGVENYDNEKLWYTKNEYEGIQLRKKMQIRSLLSEKEKLKKTLDTTTGWFVKNKRDELEKKIKSIDSQLEYYKQDGVYLVL